MTNHYPEQLAERLRAKKLSTRGLNTVAFLAIKDDVKAALDAGYVPKDIWADMRECERISFSYDTFLRFLKRFVTPVSNRMPAPSSIHQNTVQAKKDNATPVGKSPTEPVIRRSEPRGFVFNPIPNKDELI